ncbi:MAG TPA: hypothetical protein VM537_25810 [Anaerolineae bacterium]|nr:hypothetical protein [Anaerolineae bacterium]
MGDHISLRAGHVGTVAVVSHFSGDVGILLHDEEGQETVLLRLQAVTDRSVA